jgi:hypothetical protein
LVVAVLGIVAPTIDGQTTPQAGTTTSPGSGARARRRVSVTLGIGNALVRTVTGLAGRPGLALALGVADPAVGAGSRAFLAGVPGARVTVGARTRGTFTEPHVAVVKHRAVLAVVAGRPLRLGVPYAQAGNAILGGALPAVYIRAA